MFVQGILLELCTSSSLDTTVNLEGSVSLPISMMLILYICNVLEARAGEDQEHLHARKKQKSAWWCYWDRSEYCSKFIVTESTFSCFR